MYTPATPDSPQASSRDGPRGSRTSRATKRRGFALLSADRAPVGHAEASERIALAQGHAVLAPQRDRLLEGLARWRPLVEGGELAAERRRGGRLDERLVGADESQRAAVLGHGLAARGQLGGPVAGEAGVADDGVSVERALGVVGEAGIIVDPGADRARRGCGDASRRAAWGPTSCATARRAISWRNLRPPPPSATSRPAATGSSRARSSASVTAASRLGLDPLADQGGGVEHVPSGMARVGRPGRAPRRARDAGARHASAAEDFGDEERVATGERVHGSRLVARCRAQLGHGGRGQRREVDAPRGAQRGDVAQGLAQGAVLGEAVVTVGRDDHRADPAEPPGNVPEQVERRLVGEVQVLDHQDGKLRASPLSRSIDNSAAKRASRGTPSAQATRTAPPHWSATSCSGPSADGVKAPSQDAPGHPGVLQPVDEGLDQAGLADAGLPGDQHEPPVATAGVGGVFRSAPSCSSRSSRRMSSSVMPQGVER